MSNTIEKRVQFSHLGGRAAALEEVVGYLLQRSGEAFAREADDVAAQYRRLAKEFQRWAKEARREQAQYEVIGG